MVRVTGKSKRSLYAPYELRSKRKKAAEAETAADDDAGGAADEDAGEGGGGGGAAGGGGGGVGGGGESAGGGGDEAIFNAAFRGRTLSGKVHKVPRGYAGTWLSQLIVRVRVRVRAKILQVVHTTESRYCADTLLSPPFHTHTHTHTPLHPLRVALARNACHPHAAVGC